VKVGDLVQVLPAKFGYYIIVEEAHSCIVRNGPNTKTYWQLFPATSGIYSGYGPMSEEFIEVTSESR
jgi:hypothetical protein